MVLATGFSEAVPRTSAMRILLKPYDLHTVVTALLDALGKRGEKNCVPG